MNRLDIDVRTVTRTHQPIQIGDCKHREACSNARGYLWESSLKWKRNRSILPQVFLVVNTILETDYGAKF